MRGGEFFRFLLRESSNPETLTRTKPKNSPPRSIEPKTQP